MSHPPSPTTTDERFERDALVHPPDLSRYALSLTRNPSDADDLVHDTVLSTYRNRHQVIEGSECRAWLITICRHQFLRTRRRDDRAVPVEDAVLESMAAAALHASARDANLQGMLHHSDVTEAIGEPSTSCPWRIAKSPC